MLFGQMNHGMNDSISTIVLFGIFSLFVHKILQKFGFFALPSSPFDQRKWSFHETLICFGIFFLCSYFLTPVLGHLILKSQFKIFDQQVHKIAFLQTLNFCLNSFCLVFYLSYLPFYKIKSIWKDSSIKPRHSFLYDILMGILTWLVAFPVIITVNESLQLFNQFVLKKPEIDQVAVSILKNASSSSISLIFSLLIIILSAPLIEEFLFRGCLQNFLRPHVGKKGAIFIASILFGLMHYSSTQGASNLPLIGSLTTFSCYLGFIYEKTRSLTSCIFLHATFNTISALRILSM